MTLTIKRNQLPAMPDRFYQVIEKELAEVELIDICFNSKQIYSLFSGWIGENESRKLIALFSQNFATYYEMDVYRVHIKLG